jgi:hypothetical protein
MCGALGGARAPGLISADAAHVDGDQMRRIQGSWDASLFWPRGMNGRRHESTECREPDIQYRPGRKTNVAVLIACWSLLYACLLPLASRRCPELAPACAHVNCAWRGQTRG